MRTIKNIDATDFIINMYELLARWRRRRSARNVENEELREAIRKLPEGKVLNVDVSGGDLHGYE